MLLVYDSVALLIHGCTTIQRRKQHIVPTEIGAILLTLYYEGEHFYPKVSTLRIESQEVPCGSAHKAHRQTKRQLRGGRNEGCGKIYRDNEGCR